MNGMFHGFDMDRTKLRIYAGPEHEQAAQKPEVLELIK